MRQFQKSSNIHPCKLTKTDLLELIEIIKETPPNSVIIESLKISTNLPDIRIDSNNIDDFLKHKELPDKFNRLSIKIFGMKPDRNVFLTFYDNFIDLDVSGDERTWVLGKYNEITEFLKKKRPWFWFTRNNIFSFIEGAIGVLLFIAFINFIKVSEIIYSILASIMLFIFAYLYYLYFEGKILPYTQIIINEKPFFNRENLTLIIILLTLIVTTIGVTFSILNK